MSRTVETRPDPPSRPDGPHARRRPSSGRSWRRTFWIGLGGSAAIHLVLFVVVRFFIQLPLGAVLPPPGGATVSQEPGMRAYNLATVDEAPPLPDDRPLDPEAPARPPRQERDEPEAPDAPVDEEPPPADEDADRADRWLSPAERLRNRSTDPRVWAPVEEEVLAPPAAPRTMDDVRADIAGRIGEVNDSIAAENAADRAFRDWTVEGENGERWGVADGKIYLGDIALPLPFSTESRPTDQAVYKEWSELRLQADQARIRDRFEDRVEAIRRRKAREREEKKSGGSGG